MKHWLFHALLWSVRFTTGNRLGGGVRTDISSIKPVNVHTPLIQGHPVIVQYTLCHYGHPILGHTIIWRSRLTVLQFDPAGPLRSYNLHLFFYN